MRTRQFFTQAEHNSRDIINVTSVQIGQLDTVILTLKHTSPKSVIGRENWLQRYHLVHLESKHTPREPTDIHIIQYHIVICLY